MKDKCPICESDYKIKRVNTGLCLVTTCGNCGHEYTLVKDILIKETYNKEYFEKVHKNWFANLK